MVVVLVLIGLRLTITFPRRGTILPTLPANHSLTQVQRDGDCQTEKISLTSLPQHSPGITAIMDVPMKETGSLLLAIVIPAMAAWTTLAVSVALGVLHRAMAITVTTCTSTVVTCFHPTTTIARTGLVFAVSKNKAELVSAFDLFDLF